MPVYPSSNEFPDPYLTGPQTFVRSNCPSEFPKPSAATVTLNWREELDRDEPSCGDTDRPTPTEDPQAVAVRDLYAWKRRKPGRAVHLGDGYVMLSEPGSAPIAWPCAGGELPAAEIHCFCTRELFATMADLVAADMERLP